MKQILQTNLFGSNENADGSKYSIGVFSLQETKGRAHVFLPKQVSH